MKKNNKGFSLIELIVTIAIMGIVTVGSISVYSYLNSANVKQATTRLYDQIGNTRTNTLSKQGTWEMKIEIISNKYYATLYRDGAVYDRKNLGKVGTIKIMYTALNESGASTDIEIVDAASSPTVMFNSGSGACMKVGGYTVSKFVVTDSDRTSTIKLVRATGRHYKE